MIFAPDSRLLPISAINRFLSDRHIPAFVVGGAVRDSLMGRSITDIDIILGGDALTIARQLAEDIAGKYVLLDDVNQTARVLPPPAATEEWSRVSFDFTTLRGSLEEDLGSRDFTINAMAVDLAQFAAFASIAPKSRSRKPTGVVDPFNGQADLERRAIRAVSDKVFIADPLRLLRAFRLAAELGFTLDESVLALVDNQGKLITGTAGERIREELVHILNAKRTGFFLGLMEEHGLLTQIIPELASARTTSQPREHHWNVFDHSVQTVATVSFLLHEEDWEYADETIRTAVPWSDRVAEHFRQPVGASTDRISVLKLAALLHDIAKPQTKILTESGRTRFFGHNTEGAEIARGIMERLRFSTREIKLVGTLIKEHLRPGQMSQEGLPTRKAIYRFARDTGDAAIDILFLSLADHLAARGPDLVPEEWRHHTRLVLFVIDGLEEEKIAAPPRLVDGYDIIKIFGLKPGPELGALLETVREAQAAGEINSREEALDFVRAKLEGKTG